MTKNISLFAPTTNKKELLALQKTFSSKFWASGQGIGNVQKFEKNFNKFIGSKNTVAVNSGTAALHLALAAINVKNYEVILPSLSFVSTAHAILYNGGIPVFVDIEPNSLCINPDLISKKITKKTKVILPVHFGGMPANLQKIQSLKKKFGLFVVEDAAHAAGASYQKKRIGSHSDAVCFSFHPVKNLSMPTGGSINFNGKQAMIYQKIVKSLRWCGITNRKDTEYDVSSLGWNYYMNEFSAAIGLEQLKKLNKLNNIRRKIAKRYFNEIKLTDKMPFDVSCSYHLYWIQVKNRKYFMKKMRDNNIETGIHYKPIHKMTFYKNKLQLPITENISEKIVSIPIHANLNEADVSRIIKTINHFAE